MRLLITGGAGFIGSNFIRYILNKHPRYKIINLDKLTYAGNPDNLRDIEKNPRYCFVKGDIADFDLVKRLIKSCDGVINFAAESHVDRSLLDARHFINTNVYGTYVLLRAAKENKIKRFLHIGTDEVYGSCEKGCCREERVLNPSNPYSASKAAADLLVNSFFITYRMPVLITRSANNYGPYQYPEKVIPLFITNALENKPVPLYGKGVNVRDWLFVLDNCAAVDLVFLKGKTGEIYNIAAGNHLSNLKLTKTILKKLDKPESLIKFVTDRPGHDLRYSLDCRKIEALGWRQRYSFSQGLGLTIKWYKANSWWWKKLKARSLRNV
ncbi:MAG: dTDP-glucose 4,6-dehydratase [Candidatus Omnitrophota bacterium]